MTAPEQDLATWSTWRKSSFSAAGNGDCVEVAFVVEAVAVRDSKNPDGPRLEFPHPHWRRFLA